MVKSAYVRVFAAGLLLTALCWASACGGDDDDDGGSASAGSGGSAGTDASVASPIECGTALCSPLVLPLPGAPPVEACCAEGDVCGLDSSVLEAFGPTFEQQCQPKDQPGELDPACPDSEQTAIPDSSFTLSFKGCCRTDVGRCGYMLDKLFDTLPLGLGCVDSEPFLDGGSAPACGSGGTGNGGAPGDGGASQGGANHSSGASGASNGGAGGA